MIEQIISLLRKGIAMSELLILAELPLEPETEPLLLLFCMAAWELFIWLLLLMLLLLLKLLLPF